MKIRISENRLKTENISSEAKTSEEKIIDAIIKSIEEDSSVYEQAVSPYEMLVWLKRQKELLCKVKTVKVI